MTDADARAGHQVPAPGEGELAATAAPIDGCVVSAHRTAPGRTVLTDHDSTDAWIASSLTIDCRR